MDTNEDMGRFGEWMSVLVDVFQREELSAGASLAYWTALRGKSAQAVEAACREAATTCRRFPTPAELLELAEAAEPPELWRGLPAPYALSQEERDQRAADIEAVKRVVQAARESRREVPAERRALKPVGEQLRKEGEFRRAGDLP